MKHLPTYLLREYIENITAFGSLLFYGFISALFLVLGNYLLFFNLSVGLMFCYLLTALIRIIYFKNRPNKQNHSNIIEKIDASSFPSLHSMRIAFLGVLISLTLQNIFLSFLFFTTIIGVMISRVTLKKHYLVDVLAGAMLGVMIAIGFYIIGQIYLPALF